MVFVVDDAMHYYLLFRGRFVGRFVVGLELVGAFVVGNLVVGLDVGVDAPAEQSVTVASFIVELILLARFTIMSLT